MGDGVNSHMTDYLTGADQKTSDRLIKIILLVKAETAIRLGIKSRFGILRVLAQVMPFRGCGFSF